MKILLVAGVVTIFIMGSYPTTQIYQHDEDRRRGDRTISMLLGTKGTLLCSAVLLAAASLLLCILMYRFYGGKTALLLVLLMLPAAAYFSAWLISCVRGRAAADYDHMMRLCMIGATGMNLFCLAFYLSVRHAGF